MGLLVTGDTQISLEHSVRTQPLRKKIGSIRAAVSIQNWRVTVILKDDGPDDGTAGALTRQRATVPSCGTRRPVVRTRVSVRRHNYSTGCPVVCPVVFSMTRM